MSRLNLEMTEATRSRLEHLRDATNADSMAEVVRRALEMYDFVRTEESAGGDVIMRRGTKETHIKIL